MGIRGTYCMCRWAVCASICYKCTNFLSALLLLFYPALNPVYRVVVVCLLLDVRLSVSHCSICVKRRCLVNGICLLAERSPVKRVVQL